MSKKTLRPLLITGGVLLVAVVAIVWVLSLPQLTTPEAEPLEVQFIQQSSDSVERISVTPRSSDYFEITISKSLDGGESSLNVVPGVSGFSYDQTQLSFYLSVFSGLKSTAVVTKDVTDQQLELWGLANPLSRITGSFTDGTTVTLLIGDVTATADGYYAMLEGDSAVYVITTSYGEMLTCAEWDLRDMEYFAFDEEEDATYDLFKDMTLYRDGEEAFSIHVRSQEEMTAIGPGSSIFELQLSENYETNVNNVQADFLEPLFKAMNFSGIVGDNISDLASYGITDTSDRVVIKGLEGETYEITYGTAIDGVTYAFRPDTKTLYYTEQNLSFLDIEPMDLLSNILWIYSVNNIQQIDLNIDGEQHVVKLTKGTGDDGEEDIVSGTYDGKTITGTNAKRLYSRIISMFAEDEIPDGRTWSDAVYSYTLHFLDGTTTTLELCPINDRQYAMVLDGSATFYIGIKSIEYMVEALDYLESGEEIPLD